MANVGGRLQSSGNGQMAAKKPDSGRPPRCPYSTVYSLKTVSRDSMGLVIAIDVSGTRSNARVTLSNLERDFRLVLAAAELKWGGYGVVNYHLSRKRFLEGCEAQYAEETRAKVNRHFQGVASCRPTSQAVSII